jgi:hypothetical protein
LPFDGTSGCGGQNAETERPGLSWSRHWKRLRGGDGGGWRAGFDVVDPVVCGRLTVQAGAPVWGQNRAAITRLGVETWVNGWVWVVFDHLGPLGHMLKQRMMGVSKHRGGSGIVFAHLYQPNP